MTIKQTLFFISLIASFNTITPSAVHQKEENQREKFEREFYAFADASTYDTPPAAKISLALTMPQSPAQANKLTEEAHKLHLCTSMVNLSLMPGEKNKVVSDEFEPTDIADLFDEVIPESVMLVLTLSAQKEHIRTFNAGVKKLNEITLNTDLERKSIKETLDQKKEKNTENILRQNFKTALSPIIDFLSKTPTNFKAVSMVNFEDTQGSIEIYSHAEKSLPEQHLTVTIICDAILQLSPDNLRTIIGTAELPTVLREATSSAPTPNNNKSPKSPNQEETGQNFKCYNVLSFLKTLQITSDYCLSVFIRKPKALESAEATATAKK